MAVTDLYLCRHGETDYNKQRLAQGITDIPLNETGRAQAREVKRHLEEKGITFDRVITSPLCRAVETASILTGLDEREFTVDYRLVEMHFGDAEGKSYITDNPAMELLNSDPARYDAPCGGETVQDVFDRVEAFLEDLLDDLATTREESILIATHGMTLRGFVGAVRGTGPADIWKTRIGNCDILHFRVDDGALQELPPVFCREDPFDPH